MQEIDIESADITQLEQFIRGRVNHPRQYATLATDPRRFDVLCSALDAVGDAEAAIDAYLTMKDPGEPGGRYILVYGLLQIMFVEQHAVSAIATTFGLPMELPPDIEDIRKIRHYSIGHPVPNRPNAPAGFISRVQLSLQSLTVMLCWPDRPTEIKTVDIYNLVDRQRQALGRVLREVALAIKEGEMTHRKEFRDEKLTQILHPSLPYLTSKIHGDRSSDNWMFGGNCLKLVSEIIADFREALRKRGIAEVGQGLLDDLAYPIEKLTAYYANADQVPLDREEVAIFRSFIDDRISQLRRLADEIDTEYASDDLQS